MRSYGCLTPAAFLLVVGGFTLVVGLESGSAPVVKAGGIFLAAAVVLGLIALFFRWQGWD